VRNYVNKLHICGRYTTMGLKKAIRKALGYKETNRYLNESYSQEGEDMVLYRIFENNKDGVYVDVGAHHPALYSNTYKFYNMGWRGINIDAMPDSMKLFNVLRPGDINIECPISDTEAILPFYIFNEPALNTLSKELADERSKKPEYHIVQTVNLKTRTLSSILSENGFDKKSIDFLTIDAEGFDDQILRSNDWNIFRPKVVLFESERTYNEMILSELNEFLKARGYSFFAKTVKTFFYKDDRTAE